MKKELDDLLCAEFPEIFAQRHLSPRETCMCWGFACGEGWFPLIRALCQRLQGRRTHAQETVELWDQILQTSPEEKRASHEEKRAVALAEATDLAASQPVAVQVKEKFGTLRFYVRGGDEVDDALISFAQHLSGSICEMCGSMGPEVRTEGAHWISTLCPSCRRARELERSLG